jgi:hypothetical protein
MTPTKPNKTMPVDNLSTDNVDNLSTASAYALTLLREVLALNEADRAAEEARRREREDAMALLGYGS